MTQKHMVEDWLPEGRRAAVSLTIDDVHPGTSRDAFEAGGDLDRGALRHLKWLLDRHPALHVTLFVTPDWRELIPRPTRHWLARMPYVRHRVFLAPVLPAGTMRLSHHPEFVAYLKTLPRTDVALHGLHHVHKGPAIPVEFQHETRQQCRRILEEAIAIFDEAGLPLAHGMTPPGWQLPPALAEAMIELGFSYAASARDIVTPVSPNATTNMSGVKGVSLIYPDRLHQERLIHFTTNFQATSEPERAYAIVEHGGLLLIKAHIIKQAGTYIAADGLDETYRNYLDLLFTELERRYGDELWWTSLESIAKYMSCGAPIAIR